MCVSIQGDFDSSKKVEQHKHTFIVWKFTLDTILGQQYDPMVGVMGMLVFSMAQILQLKSKYRWISDYTGYQRLALDDQN